MTCSYLAGLFKQLLPYCPDISRELVIIQTCLLRPIVWSCNIKLHFYSLWDQHYSALLFCLESSGRKNTSSKKLTSFNEKTSNTKNVRERKKWIWYLSKPLNKKNVHCAPLGQPIFQSIRDPRCDSNTKSSTLVYSKEQKLQISAVQYWYFWPIKAAYLRDRNVSWLMR